MQNKSSVHFKESVNLTHAQAYNFGNIIVGNAPSLYPPTNRNAVLFFVCFKGNTLNPYFKDYVKFSQGEAAIM